MNKLFPYRLAAIDIDDTLVGEDKRVSPENAAAIQKLQKMGVHVMLASGRSHENILTFHKQLGLSGYIISAQGALTRHAETGEILHEAGLAERDALAVIEAGQARRLTVIAYARGRIVADRGGQWAAVHAAEIRHTEPVHVTDVNALAKEGLLKVVWAGDPEQINAATPAARDQFAGRLDATITCPYYLEFNTHGVSKATGLAEVARAMNIHRSQTLAFGDGNNDVAMLAWAGLGVAMDTGRIAAKRAAKRVSPAGNPETALARAIEELIEEAAEVARSR